MSAQVNSNENENFKTDSKQLLLAPVDGVYPEGFKISVVSAVSDEEKLSTLKRILVTEQEDWIPIVVEVTPGLMLTLLMEWADIFDLDLTLLVGVPNGDYSGLFNTKTHGLPVMTMSTVEKTLGTSDTEEVEREFGTEEFSVDDVLKEDDDESKPESE